MEDLTPKAPPVPAAGGFVTSLVRFLLDVLETLLLATILFAGINTVTARIRVDGASMEPSLFDGQYVLVNKLAYRWSPYQRGDVVVFYYPKDPKQEYIKRLIGLPGDVISIRTGQVTVNGQVVDEEYIAASPRYNGDWLVPEDSYFVLGDNRNNSSDSHTWGMVPAQYMIGKAILVYWPLSDLRWAPHFNLFEGITQ